MSTNINVTLNCATCGQSDFEHNDDKTFFKCNNCEREYHGGIDELTEFNQVEIQSAVEKLGQNLLENFARNLELKFKSNKHFKFKK